MCIGRPLCCMLFDLFRSAMKRQPVGGFFDQWRLCLIFKKISRLIINTSNYSNSWCTSSVYITILSDSLFRQFILGVQVEINCQVKFVCCCYRREWITTNLPRDWREGELLWRDNSVQLLLSMFVHRYVPRNLCTSAARHNYAILIFCQYDHVELITHPSNFWHLYSIHRVDINCNILNSLVTEQLKV